MKISIITATKNKTFRFFSPPAGGEMSGSVRLSFQERSARPAEGLGELKDVSRTNPDYGVSGRNARGLDGRGGDFLLNGANIQK